MTEEEQAMEDLKKKLSAMSQEEIHSWIGLSRAAQVFFAVLGTGTCWLMLAWPMWTVIVPGLVLLYVVAQLSVAVTNIRHLCVKFLSPGDK